MTHEQAAHEDRIAEGVYSLQKENSVFLPDHFREGLRRYLQYRIETGRFLRACLENDFEQAVLRAAPDLRIVDLQAIVLVMNAFPAAAWGSKAKVAAWLKVGKENP